jgi:RNA polymerase sigma-70 factor (ECF subfamily)
MDEQQQYDRLLVRRMLAGEQEAFEEFFNIYFSGLYRFVMARVGRDATAAEEIVQGALCKAVGKLHIYRGEAALFTWLCTFCRHEISKYLKQQNRQLFQPKFIQDTPEIQAALESLLSATEQRPDEVALRTEVSRLVQMVLDGLPARYADVLEWKYIEDLSVKEIAQRLNLGFKAAESLLTRAREAFKDAFVTFTTDVAWEG